MILNAGCDTWNAPLRCTSSTALRSSHVILAKDLSRRMPALLMTMSTLPNASTAVLTMFSPPSGVETESYDGTASPPAALISSTTFCAAASEPPSPLTDPPRSLTTTLAPRRARSSAYVRPRPPPAPVTIATRPSKEISATACSQFIEKCRIPNGILPCPVHRSDRRVRPRNRRRMADSPHVATRARRCAGTAARRARPLVPRAVVVHLRQPVPRRLAGLARRCVQRRVRRPRYRLLRRPDGAVRRLGDALLRPAPPGPRHGHRMHVLDMSALA